MFVGAKAEPDGNKLYFQDFVSYQRGIPFESPNADEEAAFITGAGRYIFEYERALDVLMACALRRKRKGPSTHVSDYDLSGLRLLSVLELVANFSSLRT